MRLIVPVLGLAVLGLLVSSAFSALHAEEESASADEIELILTEPLPIDDFLEAVGKVTHITFVWDPAAAPLKVSEMVAACNLKGARANFIPLVRSLLTFHELGLVTVESDGPGVYRVVRLHEAQRGASPPSGDGYRAEIVPIGTAAVEEIAPLLVEHYAANKPADREGTWLRIHADRRTNQLLVSGTAARVERVLVGVKHIDVEVYGSRSWAHAVDLNHLDAEGAVRALRGMLPEDSSLTAGPVRVSACEERNAVLISATPADYESIRSVLQQLDIPVERPSTWTHVVRLEHLDAVTTAAALQQLLPGDVRIVPHEQKNALLVTATPQQFEQLKAIVEELDTE